MATAKKTSYKLPNSKQIVPQIEKGDIRSCYLFLGEEEGEKENVLKKLADIFFGKEEHIISRFHCATGDITAAASFVMESSMFSSKKIAVVMEIETLISKRDTSLLADMINELPDNSVLVLMSTDNSVPKSVTANEDTVQPVIFWRMFENEIQNHIISRFKSAGRHIDTYAAARIVALTGRDIRKADQAVERILDGSEGPVTEKVVVHLIADEKEITVFEFIDAFFKKRKDTLPLLKKVLDDGGNELGIIALMQREAEKIESYHTLRLTGKSHDDVLGELRIPPRGLQDFSALVASTPAKKIRTLYTLLARADQASKSTRPSRELLSSPLAETIMEYFSI